MTPSHARIIAAVRASGVGPAQWARWLGITRGVMSHRLSGRTPFTLDEALIIAQRLQTTVDDLAAGRSPRIAIARSGRGVSRPHGRDTKETPK